MITKTCSKTYTADYNDLVTAINDMLASGVASGGDITSYYLSVDNSTYSGQFNIFIPYSGSFSIFGDRTTFVPTGPCSVSGYYHLGSNFTLDNFYVNASGISDYFLTVDTGCYVRGSNLEFCDLYNGFQNLGYLDLVKVNSCGLGSGTFISSSSVGVVTNSNISDYSFGLNSSSGNFSVSDSNLYGNTYDLYSSDSSLAVSRALLYGGSNISLSNSYLDLSYSTLKSSVPISGINSYVGVTHSILKSDTLYTIYGPTLSGYIEYTDMYSGLYESVNISGSTNYNADPKFVDEDSSDYRLLVDSERGSFAINAGARRSNSLVTIDINPGKFAVYDKDEKRIPHSSIKEFLYKQSDTLVFTDYGREVRMAELLSYYNSSLAYQLTIDVSTSLTNVPVGKSFNEDGTSIYPYEWDYWKPKTTSITDENTHIIPRSVVSLPSLLNDLLPGYVIYETLNTSNITVSNKIDYRGVSYDADLADATTAVLWTIEGRNQKLIKRDAYTGEVIFEYPLLTSKTANFIRPLGVILLGPLGNKWRFIKPTDPSLEYIAESKNGDFSWINTSVNPLFDLRGILAYKDNLYITGTKYISPIDNRDTYGTDISGAGCILLYENNEQYLDYIASTDSSLAPDYFPLASGNFYPTDISIYEDGTMWIADYGSTIYKYKPAYDYGLLENSYDKEVMILLREEYDNVEVGV